VNAAIQDITKLDVKNTQGIQNVLDLYSAKSEKEFQEQIDKTKLKMKAFDQFIESLYNFSIDDDDFDGFYTKLCENLLLLENKRLYDELKERSYLSLNVNFRIACSSYNPSLTYEDRFNLDVYYTSNIHLLENILEGTRAYFVEKDYKPKWRTKF